MDKGNKAPETIRALQPAIHSYMEVLLEGDNIDIWYLVPEIVAQFRVGDKIALDRCNIKDSDFMLGIFSDDTRKFISLNEERYFNSSNRCFIQIIEKIYHGNHIEFHGKMVPVDGLFYSDVSESKMMCLSDKTKVCDLCHECDGDY